MTATLIHSSGVITRRDHPRADRQCRTIRASTMPVSANDPGMLAALTASHTDRELSMSNMLAWPPPPQPQKEGFQNSMETKVGTRVQAYSAMTTPTSNRERSRPLGQASAR